MIEQTETAKPDKLNGGKPEKPDRLTAKEVLEEHLDLLHNKVPPLVKQMIKNAREQGSAIEALKLFNALRDLTNQIVDVASKVIGYQSPKLESIAVANKIEHAFVIRAPERMASVEDWMPKTGAEVLKIANGANGAAHSNDSVSPLKAIAAAQIIDNQIDEEERLADEHKELTADATDPPSKTKRKKQLN